MVLPTGVVRVPDTVLIQELGDDCVIYDMENKTYFGLDDVGVAMWSALTTEPTIEDSVQYLLKIYNVEPDKLRSDFSRFVNALLHHKLLLIEDHDTESC